MDNIFEKFRDPTKAKFYFFEVFLGVFTFCLTNCIRDQKCIVGHFALWIKIDQVISVLSFCLTNCIGDQKCILDYFGHWPMYWARRYFRFWGVDSPIWINIDQVINVLSFCLTNCIGDQKCIFVYFGHWPMYWARRYFRFYRNDSSICKQFPTSYGIF